MNLKQIEAFVNVAEKKSFSKTAKELYLTQPTVSAHILSLEKEYGIKLFARTTKEVILTEDGIKLYQYAKQMIELQHTIENLFVLDKHHEAHSISIAASTVPAQYLLPQIIANYSKKYPTIQLKIKETDSAQVAAAIANHSIDIGFTGSIMEKNYCRYIPIYRDELVIIMPNTGKYQEIKRTEKTLNWILQEPIIMREEGSGTRREAEKFILKSGLELSHLNIIANIESSEVIKQLVKNGLGITIISRLAVKEEIKEGHVLEFPLSSRGSRRTLNLVYNNSFSLSKSAKQFVQVVKEMYSVK